MAELAILPSWTVMAFAVCVALLVDILWGEPPPCWHPGRVEGRSMRALGRRIAPAACESPAREAWPFVRALGIKLRDTTSLRLPGHWCLGVLPPPTQVELMSALALTENA